MGIHSHDRLRNIEALLQAVTDQSAKDWEAYVGERRPVDLRGARLGGYSLVGFDLSLADLSGADLGGSILIAANLFRAKLCCANLRGACLVRADISSADLTLALLDRADLSHTDLRNSLFRLSSLTHSKLDYALLMGADIRLANFAGAELGRAYLRAALCTEQEYKAFTLTPDQWLSPSPLSQLQLEQARSILVQINEDMQSSLGPSRPVFVSYVREDRDVVNRLVSDLRAYGISVWCDVDGLQPGHDWRIEVERRIDEGAFFVACFSRHYWQRQTSQMNEELNLAIERIRLRRDEALWFIPVRLDASPIPDLSIRPGRKLTTFQWLDLSSDWDEGLLRLANSFRERT